MPSYLSYFWGESLLLQMNVILMYTDFKERKDFRLRINTQTQACMFERTWVLSTREVLLRLVNLSDPKWSTYSVISQYHCMEEIVNRKKMVAQVSGVLHDLAWGGANYVDHSWDGSPAFDIASKQGIEQAVNRICTHCRGGRRSICTRSQGSSWKSLRPQSLLSKIQS